VGCNPSPIPPLKPAARARKGKSFRLNIFPPQPVFLFFFFVQVVFLKKSREKISRYVLIPTPWGLVFLFCFFSPPKRAPPLVFFLFAGLWKSDLKIFFLPLLFPKFPPPPFPHRLKVSPLGKFLEVLGGALAPPLFSGFFYCPFLLFFVAAWFVFFANRLFAPTPRGYCPRRPVPAFLPGHKNAKDKPPRHGRAPRSKKKKKKTRPFFVFFFFFFFPRINWNPFPAWAHGPTCVL